MQTAQSFLRKSGFHERTMSAFEARRQFGKLLQNVVATGEKVVVERHGEPIAAVVPIELYQQWKKNRLDFFTKIRTIASRAHLSPSEAYAAVRDAIDAVRADPRI